MSFELTFESIGVPCASTSTGSLLLLLGRGSCDGPWGVGKVLPGTLLPFPVLVLVVE